MSWKRGWFTGLVIVAASLPGLLFTIDPVARDQGVFATIAWQWLEGGVPYGSAGVEHKGPLPFAAYAVSQVLFGHSIQAARLLAWIAMVVTALLVVAIARRLLPEDPPFMEPCLAGAVLSALGQRRLAAGALLGIATLGKPLAILLLPALLIADAASPRTFRWRIVVGVAVPWVVTLGYFALRGALVDLIDQVFLVNVDYGRRAMANAVAHPDRFVRSHDFVVPLALLAPAALGVARLMGWMSGGASPRGRVLILWLLAAYAQVFVQGRFFGYHYVPIVAPLAVAIGAFLAAVAGGMSRTPAWKTATFAIGALLLGVGLARLDWRDVGTRFDVVRRVLPRERFVESLSPAGSDFDVQPLETERVAAWLRANTEADATVLVWGFEPAVNFLAERRSPTRFLYDWYLTARAVDPARQARYWSIFWREIETAPPAAVVVVHGDTNPVEGKDSAAQLAADPRLAAWLAEDYASELLIGDFEVYRRVR
jgi:4-amino-4-deoxy-L-arabinose transferase-like glycosyltransferase